MEFYIHKQSNVQKIEYGVIKSYYIKHYIYIYIKKKGEGGGEESREGFCGMWKERVMGSRVGPGRGVKKRLFGLWDKGCPQFLSLFIKGSFGYNGFGSGGIPMGHSLGPPPLLYLLSVSVSVSLSVSSVTMHLWPWCFHTCASSLVCMGIYDDGWSFFFSALKMEKDLQPNQVNFISFFFCK